MSVSDYLNLIRIHQWIKNFFIFAALIFSKELFYFDKFLSTLYVFIIFCLVSSSVYIFNDISDLEYDKKHPKKKYRPLAQGKIRLNSAKFLMIIFFIISSGFSYILNKSTLIIILIYVLINIIYTLKLKNEPIIDLLIVSLGYVLRVLAGVFIIKVSLSPWMIISSFTLAMNIIIAKRYSELKNNSEENHRVVVKKYSIQFLSLLLGIFSGLTILIYTLWCIENRLNLNINLLIISNLFVFYGILRYLYLTINTKKTESPTKLILKDKGLIINILIWIIYLILIIYF